MIKNLQGYYILSITGVTTLVYHFKVTKLDRFARTTANESSLVKNMYDRSAIIYILTKISTRFYRHFLLDRASSVIYNNKCAYTHIVKDGKLQVQIEH